MGTCQNVERQVDGHCQNWSNLCNLVKNKQEYCGNTCEISNKIHYCLTAANNKGKINHNHYSSK